MEWEGGDQKLGRRIALDLTVAQARHIRRATGTARFAWNGSLADHRAMSDAAHTEPDEAKRKGRWPTTARLRARWAARRRADLPWKYEVTKCASTQAVMDLCAAFDRSGRELREAVPGVGGILGCRAWERRGRWFASFQFDTDWNDGERSDKAELIARARARKAAKVALPEANGGDDTMAGPDHDDDVPTPPGRGRPERVLPRHPRPGTVGAVDVGIVDAAVVSTGEGAPARHAGSGRSRPDRRAAVRRLIARQQRRLTRSVAKAKLVAAIAARTAPGPPTRNDVHRIKVRYSRRQERRSRAISRLVWGEADRRDDRLHKASAAVARSAEVVVAFPSDRALSSSAELRRSRSMSTAPRCRIFRRHSLRRNGAHRDEGLGPQAARLLGGEVTDDDEA